MKRERRTIGQLIREFRSSRGMTQMDLSELVGVSYQQIQKYEKSAGSISVSRLRQIAEALDVPVTRFFPSDGELVAETPAVYGKMTDDEHLLVQLFRGLRDKKIKKAVLELLKTLAAD